MTKPARFNLQTQVPLLAALKYANFRNTARGDKLKLVLVVEAGQNAYPPGEQELWVWPSTASELMKLGVIAEAPPHDGKPDYTVVGSLPRLCLTQTEDPKAGGGTVKRVKIVRAEDHAGATTKPAAQGANAQAVKTAPNDRDVRLAELYRWLEVGDAYGAALELAKRAQEKAGLTTTAATIAAGAGAILLEVHHSGLMRWDGMDATMRAKLHKPAGTENGKSSGLPDGAPRAQSAPLRPTALNR